MIREKVSKMNNNSRPPSGRRSTKAVQLANKEQEFKDMNAALEEKTASLINEAESVLRDQDSLFADLDSEVSLSHGNNTSYSGYSASEDITIDTTPQQQQSIKTKSNVSKKQIKQRPVSGPSRRPISAGTSSQKKKEMKPRAQTSKGTRTQPSMNLIEERATLADRISTLELEAADDIYSPSNMNENVLPDVANDMGPDAIIRFLKAKLRVMQEELEETISKSREKSSMIARLENEMKDRNDSEVSLSKRNEQLQNTIEKHKSTQEEIRAKNSYLESEVTNLKKDLDGKKRESKQSASNKNTLEVRLNRALEEVEKYKSALQKSKESSKVLNDTERKKLEQLQNENKKLEKQKTELMTAFKKQLKLIDVLKRQKMHIEAAKMLEFTEEEFIRALDWGK